MRPPDNNWSCIKCVFILSYFCGRASRKVKGTAATKIECINVEISCGTGAKSFNFDSPQIDEFNHNSNEKLTEKFHSHKTTTVYFSRNYLVRMRKELTSQ
jgi:hypothetical protein